MTKNCEICGKEFKTYSTGKYCSKECRKAGLMRKLEENRKRKAAARKRQGSGGKPTRRFRRRTADARSKAAGEGGRCREAASMRSRFIELHTLAARPQ